MATRIRYGANFVIQTELQTLNTSTGELVPFSGTDVKATLFSDDYTIDTLSHSLSTNLLVISDPRMATLPSNSYTLSLVCTQGTTQYSLTLADTVEILPRGVNPCHDTRCLDLGRKILTTPGEGGGGGGIPDAPKDGNSYTRNNGAWTREEVYYEGGESGFIRKWTPTSWSGLSSFDGVHVWTINNEFSGKFEAYYSTGSTQYELNLQTLTWAPKAWVGAFTQPEGENMWTDGRKTYYSAGDDQYVLDPANYMWVGTGWSSPIPIYGRNIWVDNGHIYFSDAANQYELVNEGEWRVKTWTTPSPIIGEHIWTDGTNVYYSNGGTNLVLDRDTDTWTQKTWTGPDMIYGNLIWTDGTHIYHSNLSTQAELNKATGKWTAVTFEGYPQFKGNSIWTADNGANFYVSETANQYKLYKASPGYKTMHGHTLVTQTTLNALSDELRAYITAAINAAMNP